MHNSRRRRAGRLLPSSLRILGCVPKNLASCTVRGYLIERDESLYPDHPRPPNCICMLGLASLLATLPPSLVLVSLSPAGCSRPAFLLCLLAYTVGREPSLPLADP